MNVWVKLVIRGGNRRVGFILGLAKLLGLRYELYAGGTGGKDWTAEWDYRRNLQ